MTTPLEVLYLEDSDADMRLVELALRRGGLEFVMRRADTREGFLLALQQQPPDVILADCSLPGFDGRSALQLARARLPTTPVVMITGTLLDEDAVELLRQGACDYILKDRLSRLVPAVRRALADGAEARHRREQEQRYLRQRDTLADLSARGLGREDALDSTLRRITTEAARAMDVARTSVWRYNEDRSAIRCCALCDLRTGAQSEAEELQTERYASLFSALDQHEVIAADDAHHDPRTSELSASYLTRLGISSMLDARTESGGLTAGFLAHEHVGPARVWTSDEQSFAVAMASLVSLAFEADARRRAEHSLRARARQQELLAALGRFALEHPDIDELFQQAASAAAEGLGAPYSQITLLSAGEGSHDPTAGVGWVAGWIGRRTAAIGERERLLGIMASRAAVVIDDLRQNGVMSDLLRAHGIVSCLDVPIMGREGSWGVLGAYARETASFRADDVDFLQTVANILSAAMDRKHSDERLSHLAHHDSLTDLPNRLLCLDRIEVALKHSARVGRRLAVLFMDIDRFKKINDSFGHGFGDRLLQEVASRLHAGVRAADTVARQGGDEFLVVIPEIGGERDAMRVTEKIMSAVSRPMIINGHSLFVTASVGIACYPENGSDAEALLRNADAALYAAKESGRNRYRFYSQEMNARAAERLALENDLKLAIERGQLFLQYQPQVALATREAVGCEALVRWRHPVQGVLAPGRFIPVAEDTGLIIPLGDWVLSQACRQQAQWLRAGVAGGPVAINVSAQQLRMPDFVDSIVRALEQAALEPGEIEIEVTESMVMPGADLVGNKLEALHRLGVRVAIDDFGTGYSSLSYLTQFPISRLKVDKSFVDGLPGSRESAAIAQAVVSMAHSLGMTVIAEGVETEAQAEYLAGLSCEDAQGYHFARPLLPEDCAAFVRAHSRKRARPARKVA